MAASSIATKRCANIARAAFATMPTFPAQAPSDQDALIARDRKKKKSNCPRCTFEMAVLPHWMNGYLLKVQHHAALPLSFAQFAFTFPMKKTLDDEFALDIAS